MHYETIDGPRGNVVLRLKLGTGAQFHVCWGKQSRTGPSAREIGALALKTPDMPTACVHHYRLAGGALYGEDLPLDGRIPRGQGQVVELNGQQGIYYSKSPEEDALDR